MGGDGLEAAGSGDASASVLPLSTAPARNGVQPADANDRPTTPTGVSVYFHDSPPRSTRLIPTTIAFTIVPRGLASGVPCLSLTLPTTTAPSSTTASEHSSAADDVSHPGLTQSQPVPRAPFVPPVSRGLLLPSPTGYVPRLSTYTRALTAVFNALPSCASASPIAPSPVPASPVASPITQRHALPRSCIFIREHIPRSLSR